jgi:hypothetical protein
MALKSNVTPAPILTLLPAYSETPREPTPTTVSPALMFRSPWKRNCVTPPTTLVVNVVPLNVPPLPTPLMVPASVSMVIVAADALAANRNPDNSPTKLLLLASTGPAERVVMVALRCLINDAGGAGSSAGQDPRLYSTIRTISE